MNKSIYYYIFRDLVYIIAIVYIFVFTIIFGWEGIFFLVFLFASWILLMQIYRFSTNHYFFAVSVVFLVGYAILISYLMHRFGFANFIDQYLIFITISLFASNQEQRKQKKFLIVVFSKNKKDEKLIEKSVKNTIKYHFLSSIIFIVIMAVSFLYIDVKKNFELYPSTYPIINIVRSNGSLTIEYAKDFNLLDSSYSSLFQNLNLNPCMSHKDMDNKLGEPVDDTNSDSFNTYKYNTSYGGVAFVEAFTGIEDSNQFQQYNVLNFFPNSKNVENVLDEEIMEIIKNNEINEVHIKNQGNDNFGFSILIYDHGINYINWWIRGNPYILEVDCENSKNNEYNTNEDIIKSPVEVNRLQTFGEYQAEKEAEKENDNWIHDNSVRMKVSQLLSKDYFLRDLKKIPGKEKYLGIYIKNYSVESNYSDYNYTSCGDIVNGKINITGDYFLFIFDGEKIYNELVIPKYGYGFGDEVSFSLLNTKNNNFYIHKGPESDKDNYDIVRLSLIDFKDYNGDGINHELLLTGFSLSCSHNGMGIAGYDKLLDKPIFYRINKSSTSEDYVYWLDNFRPDEKGDVEIKWRCGDHGSETEDIDKYIYNDKNKIYQHVYHNVKDCL